MDPLEVEPDITTSLVDIGAHLRQTRQAQNISLAEISAKTMIPARLLVAIEEGRRESLPETIYTRGFIRRFGDSVGLNGARLAAGFTGDIDPERLDANNHKTKKRKQPVGSARSGLRPTHLYFVYIMLICSAGLGLAYLTNPSALTLSGESSPPSATVDSPPKLVPSKPKPPNVTSAKPVVTQTSVDPDQVRVDLTIKEASWMEIVVDGKVSYAGNLSPGTNKTFVAKKQLMITAGNAGGVLLAVDKKPAKRMGQPGAIAELKLEPKSLASQST